MARRISAQDDGTNNAGPNDGGPLEAAAFISQAATELAQLAHRHQLDVLGFLLDMALLEAREIVQTRNAKRSD